ncbi:MAG: phosphatase PAP2 family protein [bacterium]|nr:phosphatase PAP2 family protein [bacterium]
MILNISYKFIIFSTLAALIFFIYPQIDIHVSSLFFSDGIFQAKNNPLVRFIYNAVPIAAAIFFIAVIGSYVYMIAKKRTVLFGYNKKHYTYLILAMIIGPVLLVNGLLKETSGRARPRHVAEFGGTKQFTPAFVFTDQCDKNCSFVCGHASAGFYFVSLALLFSGRKKRIIFWSAVSAGGIIGLIRIMMGGHFLSDVIFSFVFVYLSSLLLYFYMFDKADRDK